MRKGWGLATKDSEGVIIPHTTSNSLNIFFFCRIYGCNGVLHLTMYSSGFLCSLGY